MHVQSFIEFYIASLQCLLCLQWHLETKMLKMLDNSYLIMELLKLSVTYLKVGNWFEKCALFRVIV